LLPAFEFVTGLLNFFFVRPEIKEQIGVRHDESLRCEAAGSQGAAAGEEAWSCQRKTYWWAESAVLPYPTSIKNTERDRLEPAA